MTEEWQRILVALRNAQCDQRNDCDGSCMLSSQYQQRYPAIPAQASSISKAESHNTDEVSNLQPQALLGPGSVDC